MGTRTRLGLIALGMVVVGVAGWLVGWATHDTVAAAGGDWAAAIRNIAAWAGDASKVALGAVIGGAAGLAAGWANRRGAREDRIRAHLIEQIRETEVVVSANFRAVREVVSTGSGLLLAWRTRGLQSKIEDAMQADDELIGEIDALVALAKAYEQVFEKYPVPPRWLSRFRPLWRGLLLTLSNPWNTTDIEALETARTECLAALRRQEGRALRDEPLATVDADELRKRVDVGHFVATVARARG